MTTKLRCSHIAAGLLIILMYFVSIFFSSIKCSEELIRSVPSPDRLLETHIVERDCGGTNAFSTNVFVSCSLPDCPHAVEDLIIFTGLPSIQIEWTSSRSLLITYYGAIRYVYNKHSQQDHFRLRLENGGDQAENPNEG